MKQQVIEVHRVRRLQRRPQCGVDLRSHLGHPVESRFIRQCRRGRHPIFCRRDDGLDQTGRKELRGMTTLVQQALHQVELVVLVVDGELASEAQRLGLATKQTGAERMEGADPEPRRVLTEQSSYPLFHLPRRLVGEGDGENAGRRNADLLDESGDPHGEHPGLTRPGARDDQQRSVDVLDRLPLGRVERIEAHQGRPVSLHRSEYGSESWRHLADSRGSIPRRESLRRRGAPGRDRCPSPRSWW